MKIFKRNSEVSGALVSNKKVPKILSKIRWNKIIKWVAIILILVIIANIVSFQMKAKSIAKTNAETATNTAKVETRDIEVKLESSGTVEPLHTYNVTTLVQGEVVQAAFEEGDQVEKDDILYKISTDDLDSKLDSAKTTLSRAKNDYKKAVEKYNKSVKKYNDKLEDYNYAASDYGASNIKSTATGIIKSLKVEEGDKVQSGTVIAEIYNNNYMLLAVPFNATSVDSSFIGKTATVEISGSGETLKGIVTKVSNINESLTGNRVVNTVTIKIKNPGGLTTSDKASASMGSLFSSDEGTFTVLEDTIITADKAGKIASLPVEEGDEVSEGDVLIIFGSAAKEDALASYHTALENADDSRDSAKDSVEKAKETIEDAETSLQDAIDNEEDYSITAPISGQVIKKNTLVGDKISSNTLTTLCVIYDLSALTFEMSIDELDIKEVSVGQEVEITADALEDKTFTGKITNVSLESTTNNGVTNYPVTVQIDDASDLLPGMNVTGKIITDKVTGVLAVPSDALQRGDTVYVKDASVTKASGDVPAGFKSVEVETGLTDGDYIEIKSGITEGEEVYVTRNTKTTTTVMMPGQGGQGAQGTMPQGGGMPGQ